MPLISLSELRGDELLGVELRGLPAPVIPLLPEFFAVLPQSSTVPPDLSEHKLEARQLAFKAAASQAARLTGFIRPAGEAAATTA
jgi:hypothetical protein